MDQVSLNRAQSNRLNRNMGRCPVYAKQHPEQTGLTRVIRIIAKRDGTFLATPMHGPEFFITEAYAEFWLP